MGKFLFVGSKGGAGRTKSSLLFAAGMTALELRPLHIQVLAHGHLPALQGVSRIPFARVAVAMNEDTSVMDSIRRHAAQHPMCCPIVVDMPAERIRSGLITHLGARVLLPMRGGALEIEHAAHDYRDAQAMRQRESGLRRQEERWDPPAWVLPIGWPQGLRPEDYAAILGHRGVSWDTPERFPVVRPGIREFDPWDLEFHSDDGCFMLTEAQWDAATDLAWAVLNRTRSPFSEWLPPLSNEDA